MKLILSLSILTLLLFQCSSFLDDRPSKAKEYLESKIHDQSKGDISLIEFNKLDGVEQNIFGQVIYTMDFSAIIEYNKNCTKLEVSFPPSLYANFKTYSDQEIKTYDSENLLSNLTRRYKYNARDKVELKGTISLLKKESGWNPDGIKIVSWSIINKK